MYTLYTLPGSCSTGIVVLLEKLGVPYQLINRNDTADYQKMVPTNQVPALKTEKGRTLTEGAAIALYLLEKHNNTMRPVDIEARSEFYQWLNFDYSTLHPAYGRMFAIAYKAKLSDEVRAETLQQLADSVSSLWAILDKRLESRKFILGDQPTHADYMAAVYSSWNAGFTDTKIEMGKNVKRFIADVAALPEFKAAYEKEKLEFKKPV
ncbi:glutathione S-transferase family protein [Geopsychrobacter electrodiphilus]|uniref:glutathione S-transferase family protein n=1 Tax=Geopsychrobacter electrodiphilus TaxID=225196 RepID=UPI00037A7628|nr:glutathione S-transferase family protein [Geopsychrobacter electrodiphilus]